METFTWIGGHDVTEEYASWLRNLAFTDVVVRFGVDDQASFDVCKQYGVRFRRWVRGYELGTPNFSVEDYKRDLSYEISQSPSGKIYLDDCDALYNLKGAEAFNNFLTAIRQIGQDQMILTFYFNNLTPYHGLLDFMDKVDLSDLHINLYYPPKYLPTAPLPKVRTLGLCLWAWPYFSAGQYLGTTWEEMTEQIARAAFNYAKSLGANRMTTWTGHETEHEAGMYKASLYNYPRWWPLIKSLNEQRAPSILPLLLIAAFMYFISVK